jgi:hypothetical protein
MIIIDINFQNELNVIMEDLCVINIVIVDNGKWISLANF